MDKGAYQLYRLGELYRKGEVHTPTGAIANIFGTNVKPRDWIFGSGVYSYRIFNT